MSGDRSLWVMVITQAITDATVCTNADNASRNLTRRRARGWFNLSSKDFIEVCNLAGLDPDDVYENARAVIDRYDRAEREGQRFELLPEGKRVFRRREADAARSAAQ